MTYVGMESRREWIYVYIWLIYFAILQQLTQHCKSTIHHFFKIKSSIEPSLLILLIILVIYSRSTHTIEIPVEYKVVYRIFFSVCNFHSEFYIEFRQAILFAFSVSVLRFRSWPQSPKTFMPYPRTYISWKKQGQIRA